jgi:clan AA aspartic protease
MIVGVVNPDRQAIVYLRVRGPGGHEEEVEAVIDTGFIDYLTLPSALIARLALTLGGSTQAMLADGHSIPLDVYTAVVVWDGEPRSVPVLEIEGGTLVGMSLLLGYAVRLEARDGGRVTIEALP